MKNHKIKYNRAFAEGFEAMMNKVLQEASIETDDDKLLIAVMTEVKEKMVQKVILNIQEKYSLKLSPSQSIAMRLFYTSYINNPTSYMGSQLMKIANESHQKF